MSRVICTFLLLAAPAACPSAARAQFPARKADAAFGELRRGLESVVRAASQSGSEAPTSPLIDAQTARSMDLDNQIKSVHTYYQKRKLSRSYRAQERADRHALSRANAGRPKSRTRLTSSQYDSFTGRINWPTVLKGAPYQKNREQVDKLFAVHAAAGGGVDTGQYADIERNLKSMQAQLKKNVRNIPSAQYTYTRKFLESLLYEARSPA